MDKASDSKSAKKNSNGSAPKRNISQWLLVVLIVLVILLLLGLGWNLQRLQQQHDAVSRLYSRFDQLTSQNQQQLQQSSSQSEQFGQQLSQRVDQNDQAIKKVLDELNRHQQSDPRDWTYAEVEYLLRIANQRLALDRDVAGAQHLLKMADERLAATQNPAFIPVRREISSELANLDSVHAIDTDGVYLQLSAEQQQLAALPLAQDTRALSAPVENTDEYSGGWRQQLGRLGDQLKELVTIRHHDQPLETLITPNQEGYLRENVRLQIEQAQFALLRQDTKVYGTSLNQAIDLINRYYQSSDSGVEKAVQHLRELGQMNIRPDLPDISGALNQLHEILAKRSTAETEQATEQQGE